MNAPQNMDHAHLFESLFPYDPNEIWLAFYGWPGDGQTIDGQAGPSGLRLIGACLEARLGMHSDDPCVDLDGIPLNLRADHQVWLTDMRRVVGRLEQSGLSFILLQHLVGSQLWELHWSSDLDKHDVVDELKKTVHCGLLL